MGGQGNFSDPKLGIAVTHSPDLVSATLPALRAYQHSLPTPPPPAGSVDTAMAERGRVVFDRTCASCDIGGSGTDNNNGILHAPEETGVDGAYGHQAVPNHPAAWLVAARAVLPRRERRDPGRCGSPTPSSATTQPAATTSPMPSRLRALSTLYAHPYLVGPTSIARIAKRGLKFPSVKRFGSQ